jgi:16S rRNA (guanine527-N7)-methyltransferase
MVQQKNRLVMQGVDLIFHHFPELTDRQKEQFDQLKSLYETWNAKINVISRKDLDQFYVHHVLHSLAIAKLGVLEDRNTILDFGCGGGFPGIPLAIFYPDKQFHLVDSIAKKIKVVQGVADALELDHVEAEAVRVETLKSKYDAITCRAVAQMVELRNWTEHLIDFDGKYVFLKGGDLNEEIETSGWKASITNISDYFEEEFFETKKIVVVD